MPRLASFLLIIAVACFVLAVFQPERLTYDSQWHLRPAFEGEQAWKYGLLAILSFGFGGIISAIGDRRTKSLPESDGAMPNASRTLP
jgi:hypothetical protein